MAIFSNKWYRNKPFWIASAITILTLVMIYFWQNNQSKSLVIKPLDSAYASYIAGFTGGYIPAESMIYFRLATPSFAFANDSLMPPSDFASFEPKLAGNWAWIDNQTLVFKPQLKLKRGISYQANIHLAALLPVSEENLKHLSFQFEAIPQDLEVNIAGLFCEGSQDGTVYHLKGDVYLADKVDSADLATCVAANHAGKSLELKWVKTADGKQFSFISSPILRKETDSEIEISWNGKSISSNTIASERLLVPALNSFTALSAKTKPNEASVVQVLFSDPLSQDIPLDGFVSLAGFTDLRFEMNSNELLLYLNDDVSGTRNLSVYEGFKSKNNKQIKETKTFLIELQSSLPSIRFVGSGSIITDLAQATIPFMATGLKEVDVFVYQIYEKNLEQFFQANNFNGANELRRVARPIFQKTISLSTLGINKPNNWQTYHLDLRKLIALEPGAMYRISIKFYKHHLVNKCPNLTDENTNLPDLGDWDTPQLWYYDDSGYAWDGDYDWNQRDNPCNRAFYENSRYAEKNIICSNIGLLAKRGLSGDLQVFATNLKTAKPNSGVDIKLLDFQLQPLFVGKTDQEGKIKYQNNRKPFLVVAQQGSDKAYLRVDANNALNMSHFDVNGEQIQQGIKGYIFGERGVWRPGDSIFSHLIIEDKNGILPSKHPISFELRNPKNQIIHKHTAIYNGNAIVPYLTATPLQAVTGNYRIVAKVGGVIFEKYIKIETIKPNRLQIDFAVPEIIQSSNLKIPLSAKWLHGADAPGLKLSYEYKLLAEKAHFKQFPNFQFNDASKFFEPIEQDLHNGFLDAQGETTIQAKLPASNDLPAALKMIISGRVYEPSGDFSIDATTATYLPFKSYVGLQIPNKKDGVWLQNGRTYQIPIVSINNEGKLINENKQVMVSLHKLNWSWWWEANENNHIYINDNYNESVFKKSITLEQGKGNIAVQINYPDWGRYYLKVTDLQSGHTAGEVLYFDWPDWADGQLAGMPDAQTVLKIGVNKQKTAVGDEIQIQLPAFSNALALISIENGSSVLETHWVKAKGNEIIHKIKIKPSFAPNIYINAAIIQPIEGINNDLPIRQYGIAKVLVEDPLTKLNPEIIATNTWAPNSKITFKLKEENGKPMQYALFLVDEGLLGVTRFKTPNAWPTMYATEALGVLSWDLYDDVFNGKKNLIERLISLGGDDALRPLSDEANKRFTPLVAYLGTFQLPKNGNAEHQYHLPNYTGKIRVMAIAAQNCAYGAGEKAIEIKQDLMISATFPRVLGPKEKLQIPIQLFAEKGNIQNVLVEAKTANGLIKSIEKTQISMQGKKQALASLQLEAKEFLGTETITITAKSNNQVAVTDITFVIRSANQLETQITNHVIEGLETKNIPITPFGMKGTQNTSIQLGSVPAINIQGRVQSLLQYPHGCLEQTISIAFPQLYLAKYLNLKPTDEAKVLKNINHALFRIQQFQIGDGGFGYWPGAINYHNYATSYAFHFLTEAKRMGFDVSEQLLSKTAAYLSRSARLWLASKTNETSEYTQAYRLRVLALANKADLGAMNRLRELKIISVAARAELALAYYHIGQKEAAMQILQMETNESEPNFNDNFGSNLRDKAVLAEVYGTLMPNAQYIELLNDLAKSINNSKIWLSTQETAVLLRVLLKTKLQTDNLPMQVSMDIGSKKEIIETNKGIQLIHLGNEQGNLKIANKGKEKVYINLITQGIPEVGNDAAQSNQLAIQVTYRNKSGIVVNPNQVAVGTELHIETKITNQSSRGLLKDLALIQVFPSGWEIINERLVGTETQTTHYDYKDIRDDRIFTYFSLGAGSSKTFISKVLTTYQGSFYLPPVNVSAMYDAGINAQTKGEWIRVTNNDD